MPEYSEYSDWPEILRVLLIGNGIINNLVEPGIQLAELEHELPRLRKWLEGDLPEELRESSNEELIRQAGYLGQFAGRLNHVLRQVEALTGGREHVG